MFINSCLQYLIPKRKHSKSYPLGKDYANMFLILLPIIFVILFYYLSLLEYRKTDYYKTTHKSWFTMRSDTGNYGEYLTYKYLREYESDGARFLYNCYLPKDNGETTEIDLLMIHHSGIYVFESKNYSGWIFGSEHQKNWTKTLPDGHKCHKEYFFNPIMQNKLHIRCLKSQIGENIPMHSIIVFSERCTLKKIDLKSSDVYVIKRNDVSRTVKSIHQKENVLLSQSKVDQIYSKLYPFTQVTDVEKKKHVRDISLAHTEPKVIQFENKCITNKAEDDLLCPRCGGKLALRTATRGIHAGNQFYGCMNFPKCRYIKNQ